MRSSSDLVSPSLEPRSVLHPKPDPKPASAPDPGCELGDRKGTGTTKELVLRGDLSNLGNAFVASRRKVIGTSVPESVFKSMRAHPEGISGFYEDAVASFDGDLPALVEAAVAFVTAKKRGLALDPVQNANGRVTEETFRKIQQIEAALSGVRGASRARVLTGLIQLTLQRERGSI